MVKISSFFRGQNFRENKFRTIKVSHFQALESPSLGVFSDPSRGQISAKIPPGTFEEMFSGFCDGRRQICKIC